MELADLRFKRDSIAQTDPNRREVKLVQKQPKRVKTDIEMSKERFKNGSN